MSVDLAILVNRLRNSDGWRDVLGRLFWTKSVMGRLWDDHFRDLGHPPKFYRVQDAGFIGGSSIWWQILVILMKNHWKDQKSCFFVKVTLTEKKRQGSWPQKSGLGMHQNQHFQQKPMKNWKNPEINPPSTIEISPYSWVCFCDPTCHSGLSWSLESCRH